MPTVTCTRCNRVLTSQKSRLRGFGDTCWRKLQAAAQVFSVSGYKAPQIQKAADLLTSGGVARVGRLFRATSSNGTVIYLTDPNAGTCTCLAGQHGRRCYHLAAASVLAAA